MLEHRDLLWGADKRWKGDVPLARLTIPADVEAGVSREWLWGDAPVNGM